jgi:hypothetical protein
MGIPGKDKIGQGDRHAESRGSSETPWPLNVKTVSSIDGVIKIVHQEPRPLSQQEHLPGWERFSYQYDNLVSPILVHLSKSTQKCRFEWFHGQLQSNGFQIWAELLDAVSGTYVFDTRYESDHIHEAESINSNSQDGVLLAFE